MERALFRKPALLPLEDTRPSLFDLWKLYQFQSGLLTFKAKVPPGTVQAMLCNRPIARDHAHKILAALSELVHTQYTLQSVAVILIEDGADSQVFQNSSRQKQRGHKGAI